MELQKLSISREFFFARNPPELFLHPVQRTSCHALLNESTNVRKTRDSTGPTREIENRETLTKNLYPHLQLLGVDELQSVPLDGVQSRVGSVTRMGIRRRRLGRLHLDALCRLLPPHQTLLHGLENFIFKLRSVLIPLDRFTSVLQCLSCRCVMRENRFLFMLSHLSHWHIISSLPVGQWAAQTWRYTSFADLNLVSLKFKIVTLFIKKINFTISINNMSVFFLSSK